MGIGSENANGVTDLRNGRLHATVSVGPNTRWATSQRSNAFAVSRDPVGLPSVEVEDERDVIAETVVVLGVLVCPPIRREGPIGHPVGLITADQFPPVAAVLLAVATQRRESGLPVVDPLKPELN